MNRDCNKCVYSTRDGNCRAWTCEGTKTVEDIQEETVDKCIEILKESYPIIDNEDILYGFGCAIHSMEQLKEQK